MRKDYSRVAHNKKNLMYGDGCDRHEHCESCPFKDCVANYKKFNKEGK